MITLSMVGFDGSSDEIYSVERGSKVKVFLNSDNLKDCIYCNVTRGVAICAKRDLSENTIIGDGCIIYELVFGDFIIESIEDSETNHGKRYNRS